MKRVFITSTGRTGTRALAETFSKVDGIHSDHQPIAGIHLVVQAMRQASLNPQQMQDEISHYLEDLESLRERPEIKAWVCVDGNASWMLKYIDIAFKGDVGWVYIYRDPYDTINSLWWMHSYITVYPPDKFHHNNPDHVRILRKATATYKCRRMLAENDLRYVGAHRKLEIAFEDLVDGGFSKVRKFVEQISGIEIGGLELVNQANHPIVPGPSIIDSRTKEMIDGVLQLEDPSYDVLSTASSW